MWKCGADPRGKCNLDLIVLASDKQEGTTKERSTNEETNSPFHLLRTTSKVHSIIYGGAPRFASQVNPGQAKSPLSL